MSTIESSSVSRRDFLAGVSVGSLVLMAKASGAGLTVTGATVETVESFDPDLFVSIDPDGTVNIVAHRSEMGTGIRTGLPRVVADELEADWSRVVIQQAIGDRRLGDQNTDGSNSIRFFFKRMRVAGATARQMLEQAAADRWGVAVGECRGVNHQVVHTKSNRKIAYGDLVADARKLDVPKPGTLRLKPASQWKYIGKDVPITDMDDILTGKAVYGIDSRMENQLFAVVARPPVVGGTIKSVDFKKTLEVPGVVGVEQIPTFQGAPSFQPLGGVAVCADSTWAAIQGREALQIEWDLGANSDYDTEEFTRQLGETVNKPGAVVRSQGDTTAAIKNGAGTHMADYFVPHLSHAPMETPCAVADVKTDSAGKVSSCVINAATQNPQAVQQAVGPAMGMKNEDVIVNVTLLGAGFGRKSKPDYCVEAAVLSRRLKRPVHVTWTREDDIRHDYFHAISRIHVEAAIGEDGMPTAWLQRVAYPTIMSLFNPRAGSPAAFEQEMGASDMPFDIPNVQVETGAAASHVRIGWLRSVCHIQQNFAVCSFADELAVLAGEDSYQYLMKLLGDDRELDMKALKLSNRGASTDEYPYDIGRLKSVTRRVAELSGWNEKQNLPKGRGLGIACCRAFLGYTGHVVEVDVSPDGEVSIPNVWVVLDAGVIVSPDRVRAQVEGAAIMATSQARYGEITFSGGVANQDNFDSYRMAKMADAPRNIHVEVVKSDAAPAGVGETTVPSFAPALCNAIYAATGKRVRNLPLSHHDLTPG